MRAERVPEPGELGEAQRLVTLRERLGEDLLDARELARAPMQARAILEQVRYRAVRRRYGPKTVRVQVSLSDWRVAAPQTIRSAERSSFR
jgi:hypothetical protein